MSLATAKKKNTNKKKRIEISLHINGVAYNYGKLCTFCTKIKALYHCKSCGDFYCLECDINAHATKKRKDHIRNLLSLLDTYTASKLITYAVRYHGHLLMLQYKCRQVYKRYFNKETLCHYYYNTIYKTTTWRKPYCLRNQELFPFLSIEQGASIIQNLHHLWKARVIIVTLLKKYYVKLFDRSTSRFYYGFHGASTLIPKQSWFKPHFFHKRGYIADLLPIYTKDIAALIIQRRWRVVLIRQLFVILTRAAYDQVWDPVNGKYIYIHRETERYIYNMPKLMRKQLWDPNHIPDWDLDMVSIFLRRIGLKMYVNMFRNYGVDGSSLILLDDEDFDNIEIYNKLHRKKIQYECARLYTKKKSDTYTEEHQARRDAIRKKKLFYISATRIQAYYRMYLAKKELAVLRELKRIQLQEIEDEKTIKASEIWWNMRDNIPSKMLYTNRSDVNIKDLLPPLKQFGKNRDHYSCNGWGKYDGRIWVPLDVSSDKQKFTGDSHCTQIISLKLKSSGYDGRRLQRFNGVTKKAMIDVHKEEMKKDADERELALKDAETRRRKAREFAVRHGLPVEEDLDDRDGL